MAVLTSPESRTHRTLRPRCRPLVERRSRAEVRFLIDSRKWAILRSVPTTSDFERMLRGAALRVTRPRVAVLTAVHDHPHADTDSIIGVVREDLGEVSHQAVYDVLRALTAAGLVRRIQPTGLRGALRGAGRGQPPPRRLSVVRCHRRCRLRGRLHPLPDGRPTTRATRSTKPRSSTGADVPSASRQLLPRPAADRRHAQLDTSRATQPLIQSNQRQDQQPSEGTARQEKDRRV